MSSLVERVKGIFREAAPPPWKPAGGLYDGHTVVQLFRAQEDYLAGLSIMFATSAARPTCTVIVRVAEVITPGIERTLHEIVVDARELFDNDYRDVFFPAIAASKGKLLAFSLSSIDGTLNNSVSAWLARDFTSDAGYLSCVAGGQAQRGYGLVSRPLFTPPLAPSRIPPGLLLSPVTACNLNCVHCISRESRSKVSRWDTSIRDQLKQWSQSGELLSAASDYSGDLLFSDERYGDELEFLLALDIPFSFNTHGGNLSRAASGRLIASRVYLINISIDAATPATYQRIRRGAPPLQEVLENVCGLVQDRNRAEARNRISLSMSFTLMRSNVHELPAFVRIAQELGIDFVECRHLEAYTEDMDPESLWHAPAEFHTWRARAVAAALDAGMKLNIPDPFPDSYPVATGHRFCPEPWRSAVLLGNGDVMMCCIPGTVVGNLHSQSMEEIWNGPVYQNLRLSVNSDHPPSQCAACPIYRLPNNSTSYLPHRTRPQWRPLTLRTQSKDTNR